MELTAQERLACMQLLPREGGSTDLKIIRKAREVLSLSGEDIRRCGIVPRGNQMFFAQLLDGDNRTAEDLLAECERATTVDLGERAGEMIAEALDKLNSEKPPKLSLEYLSVWEKFVEEPRLQAALEHEKKRAKGIAP